MAPVVMVPIVVDNFVVLMDTVLGTSAGVVVHRGMFPALTGTVAVVPALGRL